MSRNPGVLVNRSGGQEFIIVDHNAYPVAHDGTNGTYRIFNPDNPSGPSYPVYRNETTGHWELSSNTGAKPPTGGTAGDLKNASGLQITGNQPIGIDFLADRYGAKPKGITQPDPDNPAFIVDERGRRYLSEGNNTYPVRNNVEKHTHEIYDPDDLVRPAFAIRQNPETGHWELNTDAAAGKGGGDPTSSVNYADKQALLNQHQQLQQQLNHLQQQQATLSHEVDASRQHLDQARGHITDIDNNSRIGQQNVSLMQQKIQQQEAHIQQLQSAYTSEAQRQAQLPQAQQKLNELKNELASDKHSLEQSERAGRDMRQLAVEAQHDLYENQRRLQEVQQGLQQTGQQLQHVQQVLQQPQYQ